MAHFEEKAKECGAMHVNGELYNRFYKTWFECSECGAIAGKGWEKFDYCPKCGAKIDGPPIPLEGYQKVTIIWGRGG